MKTNGHITIIGEVANERLLDTLIQGTNFEVGERENSITAGKYKAETKEHFDVSTARGPETKNVKVVIGSNFGDEGKGKMTDYFCSQYPSDQPVLNIRFNGGAQAAHTVVKEDGRRHVFSHFGSGSYNNNNITYLSPYFILNPILFKREYDTLVSDGINPKVYIHKDCIVTFPLDMLINQVVEERRNAGKHGSCGIGIYETVMRNENYKKVTIGFMESNPDKVIDTMKGILSNYTSKRAEELGVTLNTEELELLGNENIMENYMDDLIFMLKHTELVEDSLIDGYDNIVLEGAQGLLLDCANEEYYPHLTPSSTGLENVMNMLKRVKDCNISVCYVTRSYLTRHGAGKFKTECDSTQISLNGLVDRTNQPNKYQGNFRYGYFDIDTFKWAIKNDLKFLDRKAKIALAITHLDETNGQLIEPNNKIIEIKELLKVLNISTGYISYSEKTNDIKRLNW